MNKSVESEKSNNNDNFNANLGQPDGELFFISCIANDVINRGVFATSYIEAAQIFILNDNILCSHVFYKRGSTSIIVRSEQKTYYLRAFCALKTGWFGTEILDATNKQYDINIGHPYFEKMRLKTIDECLTRFAELAIQFGAPLNKDEVSEWRKYLITGEVP